MAFRVSSILLPCPAVSSPIQQQERKGLWVMDKGAAAPPCRYV